MIITIANLKGGCGKTTTAMALAAAAAKDGKDMLVLDIDQQASATQWAIEAEPLGGLPFEVDSANAANIGRKSARAAGSKQIWTFIDCPPNGDAIDRAASVADLIIVPTGTGAADMSKTAVVASSMIAAKRPYAVLVTLARKNTVALSETTQELEESGVETFSTVIPLREDLRTYFGGALGEDLYGYEDVYAEIKQKLEVE